ncbi:IQ domain-containing protein IQM1-like [Prunus yedoensis var. nudiflora]|uniref:IQ domain-containing protein IQM1-like n=1 Tax=Prunus yedoensis var. nudiflora TaxID=2094558 RepID=A0A314XN35_PRUYE|nr:IQ domain-containing protein IQM1-like [Prunus yedoensis var. nudiflora]
MVILTSTNFKSKRKATSRTVSFKKTDLSKANNSHGLEKVISQESISSKKRKAGELNLWTCDSLKTTQGKPDSFIEKFNPTIPLTKPEDWFSPRSPRELDAAAIKLQKVYKSYQTKRNIADCSVVAEDLWWQALEFAALRRSSVSFFGSGKSETAVSRWARARTRAAKVGKGLSTDEKAPKLALRHWLEASKHAYLLAVRYRLIRPIVMDKICTCIMMFGFSSGSFQPFFYWLDVGDGKEVNLDKCPRADLQGQCIKYLGPKEREAYEVIVESGKLVYRQSRKLVNTAEGCKWIFVLSTSRKMYVGEKKKGLFQHSTFLAGGATIAAGRIVAFNGVLEAVWSYSGHYRPTEENFMEFISFLEEHQVDLTDVKKYPIDDDVPPSYASKKEMQSDITSANVDVVCVYSHVLHV